jgi:hypothetical protein
LRSYGNPGKRRNGKDRAMESVINFNLIKHPMNWVIVTLMVLIAAIAVNAVVSWEKS